MLSERRDCRVESHQNYLLFVHQTYHKIGFWARWYVSLTIYVNTYQCGNNAFSVSVNVIENCKDYAMKTLIIEPHLFRDNQGLKEMEAISIKDKEYSELVHALRSNKSNRTLLSD